MKGKCTLSSDQPLHERLPQPLGRILARLRDARDDPHREREAALKAFETCIRWLALIVIQAKAALREPVDEAHRVRAFLERPSFGAWFEFLLRHGRRPASKASPTAVDHLLSEIHDLLSSRSIEGARLLRALRRPDEDPGAPATGRQWHRVLRQFPAYRNLDVHGGLLPEIHYKRLAPLLRDATQAFLEEISSRCYPLRLARPMTGGYKVLEFPGGFPRTVAIRSPLPSGASPDVCYLADPASGSCLLSLGDLVILEKDTVYLFDRAPARGGYRHLDFSTSRRTQRRGVAFQRDQLIRALSTTRPLPDTDRVRLELVPLRRVAALGDPVPFRFLAWSRAARKLHIEVELESEERACWSFDGAHRAVLDVPVGEMRSVLLWARVDVQGVIPMPRARLVAPPQAAESLPGIDAETLDIRVNRRRFDRLVGREEHQRSLSTIVEGLEDQPGSFVAITGEMGSGKSALLEWLSLRTRSARHREIRGSAAGGGGQPLKAFQDLLHDLLGVMALGHTDDSLREYSARALSHYLVEDTSTAHYFATILHGDVPEESSEGLRPYRWFRLFSAAASEAPLTLIIDDLHEADLETLILLRELLDRFRQQQLPVLVVVALDETGDTARTRNREAIESLLAPTHELSQILPLAPLAAGDVETLVDILYPGTNFRDDIPRLAGAVLERSSGNAAHVLSLLGDLGRSRLHPPLFRPRDETTWQVTAKQTHAQILDRLPLQPSEALEGSVHLLPAASQLVLEYAALLGREFPVALLERLEIDGQVLADGLDGLESNGFLEPANPEFTRYRFRTALTAELVRERLTRNARHATARKRIQLAEAIQEEYGSNPAHAEWVGELYRAAGRPAMAISFLSIALKWRVAHGQYADGIALFEEIRSLPSYHNMRREDQGSCLRQAALAFSHFGQYREAKSVAKDALDIASQRGDQPQIIRSLNSMAEAAIQLSSLQEAYGLLRDAEERALKLGAADLLARCRLYQGVIHIRQGHFENARKVYRSILRSNHDRLHPSIRFQVLNNLGSATYRSGRLDEAESCFKRALSLAEELENQAYVSASQVWLAAISFSKGDLEQARSIYLEAIDSTRLLGHRRALARNHRNLAEVAFALGAMDGALRWTLRSIEIFHEIPAPGDEARSRILYAILLQELGQDSRALEELDSALEMARETESGELVNEAILLGTLLALDSGEAPEPYASCSIDAEAASPLVRALTVLVKCRRAALAQRRISGAELDHAWDVVETLPGAADAYWRCQLAAAIADCTRDGARASRDLSRFVEQSGDLPCGAPLDLVYAALARAVECKAPEEGRKYRAEAQRILEMRAKQIKDPQIRERFLEANM